MNIIAVLVPVFLVIGLGFLSVKTKIFKADDSYIFSRYDFYIGFPFLIFYSLLHTDFQKISNVPFLITNIFNIFIAILLVLVLARLLKISRKLTGIFIIGSIYGNVAYMGIPINQLLFGQEGIGYASVIVGIVSILTLSIGIFSLEYFTDHKPDIKKIFLDMLKNPILFAVVLGVLASAFKITLWAPLDDFLSLVSKSASPIALFAIGMFLVRKRAFKNKGFVFVLILFNLIVLPLITYLIAHFLNFSGVPFKVSVIEAAMPLAATNFVLAQRYNIGEEIIANAIIISTVLSIFSLGVLISFIH